MTSALLRAYRLRLKRRHLLWRSLRARHDLRPVADRTAGLGRDAILAFLCVRNEALRLPYLLSYYRRLGVTHFLVVDNESDDGTEDLLSAQPDVSLWRATGSYRASRFGMTWIGWLLMRHGHGRWCLTVDADELLVFPHQDRGLRALTERMDQQGQPALPALMVELYPKGRISGAVCPPGEDPVGVIPWFDADGYQTRWQPEVAACRTIGGPRARVFFQDMPDRAPTLDKLPLVRWHWRYAFDTSTHRILPRRLARQDAASVTAVLLHTKFLSDAVPRAAMEKQRGQHFNTPLAYDGYYDALAADPDLWTDSSRRYEGWQQLEALGLMSRGAWV